VTNLVRPVDETRSRGSVSVEFRLAGAHFTVAVLTDRAPVSSAYFLTDVDAGVYHGSGVFRIVKLANQRPEAEPKIEVMQMGHRAPDESPPASIAHETTGTTGLRHRAGTISLARFAPGAVYHSVFACMRDEPCLDEGGTRHPDGLGFAAFGQVEQGFDLLLRLFAERSGDSEYLADPIRIDSVRRISG
jgi:peptidyl-prolyl cis-trans isomerase A (cyclophilin A)